MKTKLTQRTTGELFSHCRNYGWRYFRLEVTKLYFGVWNDHFNFNYFIGVKVGPAKIWLGWHRKVRKLGPPGNFSERLHSGQVVTIKGL